jgi:hypothetical protein
LLILQITLESSEFITRGRTPRSKRFLGWLKARVFIEPSMRKKKQFLRSFLLEFLQGRRPTDYLVRE